ncbi:hypothetical protein GGR70_003492 [Xanthomonas campestris]|nr:hypothetical protein [Xanthomonas campestris]
MKLHRRRSLPGTPRRAQARSYQCLVGSRADSGDALSNLRINRAPACYRTPRVQRDAYRTRSTVGARSRAMKLYRRRSLTDNAPSRASALLPVSWPLTSPRRRCTQRPAHHQGDRLLSHTVVQRDACRIHSTVGARSRAKKLYRRRSLTDNAPSRAGALLPVSWRLTSRQRRCTQRPAHHQGDRLLSHTVVQRDACRTHSTVGARSRAMKLYRRRTSPITPRRAQARSYACNFDSRAEDRDAFKRLARNVTAACSPSQLNRSDDARS